MNPKLQKEINYQPLFGFAIKIGVGVLLFLVIAMAAFGLDQTIKYLEQSGIDRTLATGLHAAKYAIFIFDILIIFPFLTRNTISVWYDLRYTEPIRDKMYPELPKRKYQMLSEFAIKTGTVLLVFLVITLTAIGLDLMIKFLETKEIEPAILIGFHLVEYAIIILDILLFFTLFIMTTLRAYSALLHYMRRIKNESIRK